MAALGAIALICGVLAFWYAPAQAQGNMPKAPEVSFDIQWDEAQGKHPGLAVYKQACAACHRIDGAILTGPSLRGLKDRVPGKRETLEFVWNPSDPDIAEHFKKVEEEVPGAMTPQMYISGKADENSAKMIADFIDWAWRDFPGWPEITDADIKRIVENGRRLISGREGFEFGGPSCISCHAVGSDPDLGGATVAPDISGSVVDFKDEAGLKAILSGPDAPVAHSSYADVEGGSPLTDDELKAVVMYLNHAARLTGTERNDIWWPLVALLAAAMAVFVFDAQWLGKLFAEEPHDETWEESEGRLVENRKDEPEPESVSEEAIADEEPKTAEESASDEPADEVESSETKAEESDANEKATDEPKAEDSDESEDTSSDGDDDKKGDA